MNLIYWRPSIRTILAGMLIAGSFAGVQARQGYLPRLSKHSSKPAATKPAEAEPQVPTGRVVIPLNRLTASDVARILDEAYGRDHNFEVVKPSRLAKGIIVIGPKSEIDGIKELLAHADPTDRNFLIANKAILLKEGVVSEAELEAELPDSFYAEARKNAEQNMAVEKPSWQEKANPINWFSDRPRAIGKTSWKQKMNPINWLRNSERQNKPTALGQKRRKGNATSTNENTPRGKSTIDTQKNTAIKLAHADATDIATQMQALYGGSSVRVVPVAKTNLILVTGSKSETRDIHRSVMQLDQAAASDSASEIADATQYIRKMAASRNSAFRITRPHKPRIRPLPPISITGDPEPEFNRTLSAETGQLDDYVKPLDTENKPIKPKKADPLQEFFENYKLETLDSIKSLDTNQRRSQADALHKFHISKGQLPQPKIEVHMNNTTQSVTDLLQYLYTRPAQPQNKPSGSSATYQKGTEKPISTKAQQ